MHDHDHYQRRWATSRSRMRVPPMLPDWFVEGFINKCRGAVGFRPFEICLGLVLLITLSYSLLGNVLSLSTDTYR